MDIGSGLFERNVLTVHIVVSLLKSWKMTMVGIECDDAAF